MGQVVHKTEVVVIGAGAVGCSIAYQLARRGKDVTLVDRAGPGAGTSSFNFGLVWVHSKEPHTYMEYSLRSSKLWPQLVEELGEDVDLRQGGGLSLARTEAEYQQFEAMHERQRRSPLFEGRMLSPAEVFEIQPGASREIVGASWSPHDGDVNWRKWTQALARGCKRAGVTILRQTEVTNILCDKDNCIIGVGTTGGQIGAEQVVSAAGPWSKRVAAMVDLEIDLRPQRGQILVTEPTRMICPTPMSWVRQDPNGPFYLGTTAEEVGFDWTPTQAGYDEIRARAATLVPATQDLHVVEQFAGLRPMPRDELPILGLVPHVPGFYIAVGHSGITLSPIHGKVITDLIVKGETDVPIADYNPLRFDSRYMPDASPQRDDRHIQID